MKDARTIELFAMVRIKAVTLGQTLFCTVAPIQGAVAYAWYVSTTTGSETLQAISTINRVRRFMG